MGAIGSWGQIPLVAVFQSLTEDKPDAQNKHQRDKIKHGFDRQEALEKLKAGTQLTRAELLRCWVNYFTQGLVLVTKDFVESAFQRKRDWFAKTRQVGAKTLLISDEDLNSLK